MAEDRFIAPDIEAATALVRGGSLSTLFRALPALPALWIPA
jgi:histidine ammonia-lyase